MLPQIKAEVAIAAEVPSRVSFNQPLYGAVFRPLQDSLILLGGHVDVVAALAAGLGSCSLLLCLLGYCLFFCLPLVLVLLGT